MNFTLIYILSKTCHQYILNYTFRQLTNFLIRKTCKYTSITKYREGIGIRLLATFWILFWAVYTTTINSCPLSLPHFEVMEPKVNMQWIEKRQSDQALRCSTYVSVVYKGGVFELWLLATGYKKVYVFDIKHECIYKFRQLKSVSLFLIWH